VLERIAEDRYHFRDDEDEDGEVIIIARIKVRLRPIVVGGKKPSGGAGGLLFRSLWRFSLFGLRSLCDAIQEI
jgi:hypothetical protein